MPENLRNKNKTMKKEDQRKLTQFIKHSQKGLIEEQNSLFYSQVNNTGDTEDHFAHMTLFVYNPANAWKSCKSCMRMLRFYL